MKKNLLTRTILMAGIGCSSASAAIEIEEVVVTAQKRSQNSQDVPIAMEAFSASEVEERGINGVADLSVQTPSLQYGEAAGYTQLSIRGVGFSLFTGAGENSVAVHSDGLYIANPGAISLMQSDIASIEVLKGPQGTLWGRNATAGVVNFITEAPADETSVSLSGGYGNYNAQNFSADVSMPLSDDVRARAVLSRNTRDGYVSNPNLDDDLMGHEQTNARLSFDIDVSDDLFAQVRLFSADRNMDGPLWDPVDDRIKDANPIFANTYDTSAWGANTNNQTRQDEKLRGGSVRFDYDINDTVSLASITGLVDFERQQNDLDMDGTSVDYVSLDRSATDQTYTQEFNLSGAIDELDWLVGAFFMKQELTSTSQVRPEIIANSAPLTASTYGTLVAPNTYAVPEGFSFDFSEDIESIALFADSTYNLNDTTRVFGGIRWMQEERKASFTDVYTTRLWTGAAAPFSRTDTVSSVPACDNFKSTQKVTDVTGRLGAQFDVSDESMVYVQASNGFKSGGHNTALCNNAFEPETLTAFEVGIKSMLLDGRIRLNGAIFAYDYSDLQVEEIIGNASLINNADADILGAEVDILYYATDRLKLNAGLTLLDAEFTKFENTDTINDPASPRQDLAGNPLLRSPDWAAVLGAQYEWDFNSGDSFMIRTDISASGAYQLREFNHPADEQSAYTLINLSSRYLSADEQWEINAWVKNLTNEKVLYSLINANTLPGQGWASGVWSEPRMFGIDAKYHF